MRQDTWSRDSGEIADDSRDHVDGIIERWGRERPDLDTSAKHVTGRIIRLSAIFQAAFAEAYAPLGINESDFGVLATLRRAGDPFELTPTMLARNMMMTSGGMTATLDRVERKGLISRAPNPADRRGSLVRLTDEGRRVIDAAMVAHTEVEHALVEVLGADERATVTDALRRLLLAVDEA